MEIVDVPGLCEYGSRRCRMGRKILCGQPKIVGMDWGWIWENSYISHLKYCLVVVYYWNSWLNVVLQVLTYAQQSRERSNYEQAALNEKMQEYKRQVDRESKWSSNGTNGSPNGDGIQAIGRSSHKMIEAVMQSAAKGKVYIYSYIKKLLSIRLFFFQITFLHLCSSLFYM